jgi:hypothetical protein
LSPDLLHNNSHFCPFNGVEAAKEDQILMPDILEASGIMPKVVDYNDDKHF